MRKIALITGSSRGIGRAIAQALALDGFDIAINCRRENEEARLIVDELQRSGYRTGLFPCDVADLTAVEQMREAISCELGDVTALVNNAGFSQQKLFCDIQPQEWDRMIGVHLTGTYNTCRTFLPSMIQSHSGGIVNISSMWGQTGGSCEVHYSAAKAGVIGLTKALAKEVGPAGVRVNCVAPGVIMTDMMCEFDEETQQALAQDTPLMRLGTAEEVADTVAFLLSDKAAFITGQVIATNGGIVI